ncbi:MAG: hypothetical protein OEM41_02005, partial [Ignavibacteria bacterium]|nr:hypothetical protein [Ignavibacteria bacterium]
MRPRFGLLLFALVLGGCSAYKELAPDPKLESIERGYVELRNDDENFELEQGKKYFIKFPAPLRDRFNLVLRVNNKPALLSYLTPAFEDGNDASRRIPDQMSGSDSLFVFAVDPSHPVYYWVIDLVQRDMQLVMHYRYVPEWRFTFENRYRDSRNSLDANTVSRSTFNAITLDFDFDRFEFERPLGELREKTPQVQKLRDELEELAGIFPPEATTRRDTAYVQYLDLKQTVGQELEFQENYLLLLEVFKKEREARNSVQQFVEAIPFFAGFFSKRDEFPPRIIDKARQVFVRRLAEATAYFDGRLRSKSDLAPLASMAPVLTLYTACNVPVPQPVENMNRFVIRFNLETEALSTFDERLKTIDTLFTSAQRLPSDSLLNDLLTRVNNLKAVIPESQAINTAQYGLYPCAILLDNSIRNARRQANFLQSLYQSGQRLVTEIRRGSWPSAEGELKSLFNWTDETAGAVFLTHKDRLVRAGEDEIFNRVREASRQRVDAFVAKNLSTINNVVSLYADSVFRPVYDLRFSTLGQAGAVRKGREIESYLEQKKTVEFPENAIKTIYRDFTRDLNDRGVEKARAIVEHGKWYKGNDKQVKGLIDECDVNTPKWIVRAKEYRKLYALPVTTASGGTNQYMFRIRLQIPSDAQFPVFDVNIKLPEEVARNAGARQWYNEITINKTPIKN